MQMRALALSLVVIAASPAVFALNATDGSGVTSQFPSACAIVVPRPDTPTGDPRSPRECSCVLVGPEVVLTNSSCVSANVEDADPDLTDGITVYFGNLLGTPTFNVDEIVLYRYYDPLTTSVDGRTGAGFTEFALLHLTADALDSEGIEPAIINTDPIESLEGTEVTIVGFGTDKDQGDFDGQKRAITVGMRSPVYTHFLAGTDDETTCRYDAGAPIYAMVGGEVRLIGLTAFDLQDRCFNNINRMRIDRVAEDFIIPYVARFQDGSCGTDATCEPTGCDYPDNDCADCTFDGTCDTTCGATDWDCPLGSLPGQECEVDADCEFGGTCVAAMDDPTFLYCSVGCDNAGVTDPAVCSNGLLCDPLMMGTSTCTYGVPSRGSQGFACVNDAECRSNICEGGICVFPCPSTGCPAPTQCLPSENPNGAGMMVCRSPTDTGGGGFCSVPGEGSGGAPVGFLVILGACGLVFSARRRG